LANRASVQFGFYGQDSLRTETSPQFAPNLDPVIGRFNPLVPEGQPVIGDWTGNGMMRIGVFHNGTWYLDLNGNQRWDGREGGDGVFSFGMPGDIPVPGDWAGDGKTRLAVFRRGQWIIDMNGNMAWDPNSDRIVQFGLAGDIPVVTKWSHDRADRVGIFRGGTWIVDSNGDGAYQSTDLQFAFGSAGDIPVVSFGNGNIGVYRNGVCILAPNGARGFDSKTVITVPCGAAPLIAAW
jgi:hypothetical protein